MIMDKMMNVYGINKEVKFVEVIEKTGTLKIFFMDKTFVMVEGVKINIIED
jgi:hypothetical protein